MQRRACFTWMAIETANILSSVTFGLQPLITNTIHTGRGLIITHTKTHARMRARAHTHTHIHTKTLLVLLCWLCFFQWRAEGE